MRAHIQGYHGQLHVLSYTLTEMGRLSMDNLACPALNSWTSTMQCNNEPNLNASWLLIGLAIYPLP